MEDQVNKLLDSVYFRLSLEKGSIIDFKFEKTLAIRTYQQLLQISKDNNFLEKIIVSKDDKGSPDFIRVLCRLNFYCTLDSISEGITGQQAYEEIYNKVSDLQPLSFISLTRSEWENYIFILFLSIIDVILEEGKHSLNTYLVYIMQILTKVPLPIKVKKEMFKFNKNNISDIIKMLSDFGNPLKINNAEFCINIFQRISLFDKKAFSKAGSSIIELLQDRKTGRVFKWEDICSNKDKSIDSLKNLVSFDTTGLTKREICAILSEDAKEEEEEEEKEEELNLQGDPIPKHRLYIIKVNGQKYKYDLFDLKKLVDQGQIWDPYHRFHLDHVEIKHRYITLLQTLKRSAMGNILDDIKQTPIETTQGRLLKVWFRFKYPIPLEVFTTWDLNKYSLLVRYLGTRVSEKQAKQLNFSINNKNREKLLQILASILDEITSNNKEMEDAVEQALHIVQET